MISVLGSHWHIEACKNTIAYWRTCWRCHEMHPFSCIYDPLTIQLKQISTQFQIYLHQSFVENFLHTQYHGWAMRSW